MKMLVILASVSANVIVLCSSNAIPLVPGDNSHYIEGESRFLWMPDGDQIPHLVDLYEEFDEENLNTRDGSDNQYWLYTRSNPNTAQIITDKDISSISNSSYDSNKPLKVIVHGWNNNGNSTVNTMITAAFLAVLDTNVIVVDWNRLSSSNYISATNGVPSVGQYLGNFLVWLIDTAGGDWNNVHLVGHSLGAHAVGNAGRTAGGLPARISALDLAGPLWYGNEHAFNISDGQYTECIHTDGGVLGKFEPSCHVDFYPNHGINPQPGCLVSTCSHSRSYELFASSIYSDHFIGQQCTNIFEAALNECTGSTLNMGNSNITKQGSGLYGLTTGSEWPY